MHMSTTQCNARVRVDLAGLARVLKLSLPNDELAHYERYTTAIGRSDFAGCKLIAGERADPQLWVGKSPLLYKRIAQAYRIHEKVTLAGDQRAEDAAWTKFLRAEALCARTNKRFRTMRRRSFALSRRAAPAYELIESVRQRVQHYLGALTLSRYESIVKVISFGPGMSLSSADPNKVTVPFKLSDLQTVTPLARPIWRDACVGLDVAGWWEPVESDGLLKARLRVREVPGCRFTFVDKTVDEKRTIAIEPSANMSAQLAIHRHLVPRLKKLGLDLTDQTRNRRLALEGSLSGELATVDLSSASDTVALEVVRELLPREWFEFLYALRSPSGTYRGKTVVLEKFSSMGNGFTFVLESIIFRAIVDSVVAKDGWYQTAVYGDDLIVPTSAYSPLVRALRFFGFVPNPKKSFSEGPFRESCGLDAFDGVDVRPAFPKGLVLTIPEAVSFHNHLWVRDQRAARVVESWIPVDLRLYGPPCPGKTYLFTEDPVLLGRFRKWNKDWQTHTYLHYVEIPVLVRHPVYFRYLAALHSGGSYSKGTPLRDFTKLVKRATPG